MLLLLVLVLLLAPLVGGGFLVAWGIRALAAGMLAKGLLMLAATFASLFFFYRWVWRLLNKLGGKIGG